MLKPLSAPLINLLYMFNTALMCVVFEPFKFLIKTLAEGIMLLCVKNNHNIGTYRDKQIFYSYDKL